MILRPGAAVKGPPEADAGRRSRLRPRPDDPSRRIAKSIFVGWAECNEAHQCSGRVGWWASLHSTHPTKSKAME